MDGSRHAELQQQLEAIASEVAHAEGVEVVELILRGSSAKRQIRIDIDRPGTPGVDLGDCERYSRALGDALDGADSLPGSYVLEVSSPGLDRPLRSDDDYRRNVGRRVVVETTEPVEGRVRFVGELVGLSEGVVRLREAPENEVRIPFQTVRLAQQYIEF